MKSSWAHNSLPADAYAKTLRGNFSGKITDAKTGLPLAGASVYFSDIRSGASTDANGFF